MHVKSVANLPPSRNEGADVDGGAEVGEGGGGRRDFVAVR